MENPDFHHVDQLLESGVDPWKVRKLDNTETLITLGWLVSNNMINPRVNIFTTVRDYSLRYKKDELTKPLK